MVGGLARQLAVLRLEDVDLPPRRRLKIGRPEQGFPVVVGVGEYAVECEKEALDLHPLP